ncbi:MAG: hypothetical protein WA584_11835 [Pyrinomonadaceae bacterium]
MFGIAILDVVIGMVFIYLLLSLVCSTINEIIEAFANKRAEFLLQGVKDLLNDSDGTGLTAKLYEHPLVAALIQKRHSPKPLNPSYIPARNFALALMDIVSEAGKDKKSGSAGATPTRALPASIVVNTAPASTKTAVASPPAITSPLEGFRETVANFDNEDIRKALLPLIDAAGSDAAKARENIENWFNSGMDKVSGWYKRRSQIIILIIGFIVAIFLNADSISISNQLWHDKPLRDSLVAASEEAVKNNPTETNTVVAASESVQTSCKGKEKKGICSDECLKNVNLPECRLDKNLKRIESLGVPIGWSGSPLLSGPDGDLWGWLWSWIMKLFGLVITAFALSLGAPFWFDLLNKFVVIRSTVKPREKSHEEPSKD